MLHYLISPTALKLAKKINVFKKRVNDSSNFQAGVACDNDEIRMLDPQFVKKIIKSIIYTDGKLDEDKLTAHVNSITRSEVSVDINNSYEYLIRETENDYV